jgi:hypothetical protein
MWLWLDVSNENSVKDQWLTSLNLATWEAEIRRIADRGQPRQVVHETHLQSNQSKMNWTSGSSSTAPALQVQSSEFKPQAYEKADKTP